MFTPPVGGPAVGVSVRSASCTGLAGPARPGGPPEGNFPLFIVVAHGLFAVSTVVLVLLSALGVGGSWPPAPPGSWPPPGHDRAHGPTRPTRHMIRYRHGLGRS